MPANISVRVIGRPARGLSSDRKKALDAWQEESKNFLAALPVVLKNKNAAFRLPDDFYASFDFILNVNPRCTTSRGGYEKGRPYVSIANLTHPRLYFDDAKPSKYREYKQMAKSKTIGNCQGSFKVFCWALLAHEMAHAIQYYFRFKPKVRNSKRFNPGGFARELLKPPHGHGFQEIYRYLRMHMVNTLPGYQFWDGTDNDVDFLQQKS
ncbi:MAG: hypothetical protein GY774_23505 [Planctomycetes bacterium]|nr:hypothetical protein [Planctomycetota bacterium]